VVEAEPAVRGNTATTSRGSDPRTGLRSGADPHQPGRQIRCAPRTASSGGASATEPGAAFFKVATGSLSETFRPRDLAFSRSRTQMIASGRAATTNCARASAPEQRFPTRACPRG
jgi:hypothetical protein